MFLHNFKYSLKVLFKSRMLLFWTFAFPIILGIFFNMAFSDIESNEKLDIINIAIIDNDDFNKNEVFKEAFKTLSDETSKDRLFNSKYVSLDNAKQMLENSEITGYVLFDNEDITINVNSSGVNETILRNVVDEIQSNKEIIQDLVENKIENEYKHENINLENGYSHENINLGNGYAHENIDLENEYNQENINIENRYESPNINIDYEKIYKEALELVENSNIKLNDISSKNLSYTMIEYYTLIAMACLYGGTLSMFITNYKLANMNSVGKRTAISPIKKGKMLLGSLCASYIVQLLGIAILFIFTIFVLKVDFGTNLPLIILLAIVGSLAGLSLRSCSVNIVKNK